MKPLLKTDHLRLVDIHGNEINTETRVIKKVTLTGIPVLDMLSVAIKYHQDNYISLRSIALKPRLYENFFDYMNEMLVKKSQGKIELNKADYMSGGATLVLYDIDIKCGSKNQKENMYFEEYYKDKKAKEKKIAIFGAKIRAPYNES